MMQSDRTPPSNPTRRSVLRQGAKIAYVAPVVIAAMKVETTVAASGGSAGRLPGGAPSGPPSGPPSNKDKKDKKDK